jgi:hypothetical protein
VGYRPDPDSEGGDDLISVKTFSFALLAAPLTGLFLLVTGLGEHGGYVRVAIGALLLAVSPFILRWVWRGGLWD